MLDNLVFGSVKAGKRVQESLTLDNVLLLYI